MQSTAPGAPSFSDLGKLQSASERLAEDLRRRFTDQVERALGVGLDDSVTSLAYVDHYLAQARGETREPILTLLAAGAGAWFGDLVIRTIGGAWLGDGQRATSLRVLLAPQLIYFSPFAIALEATLGEEVSPGDPRAPADAPLDAAFHFAKPGRAKSEAAGAPAEDTHDTHDTPGTHHTQDDQTWLAEALTNLAPVPQDHFHSLTCRFETLELMLELLAGRQAARGCSPHTYTVADYVAAFDRSAGDRPS
ncbi:MAG: hypothetical protein KC486_27705 [Myxococcales bacterium]|nr:hypothetical protein [Myxococcales bacterium]